MDKNELSVVLGVTIPKIIKLIVENSNMTDSEAIESFYGSNVYAMLEDEGTKLWHFSPLTLYNMYDEEQKTGKITFPEEA